MTISETLVEARRHAGLTVAEVSQRTRIRESIIRDIERGDYSACGGDFYARGHIRSIAQAVGIDPAPLVREYDATRGAKNSITAAELFRPVTPITLHERPRRGIWVMLTLAAAVIGLIVYLVIPGSSHPSAAPPAPGAGTASHHHTGTSPAPSPTHSGSPTHTASPTAARYAHKVVIHLVAVQDCWVEFSTGNGRYLFQQYIFGGTSRHWTFRRAVAMRIGNPRGIRLRVDGKRAVPRGTIFPITLRLGLHRKITVLQST